MSTLISHNFFDIAGILFVDLRPESVDYEHSGPCNVFISLQLQKQGKAVKKRLFLVNITIFVYICPQIVYHICTNETFILRGENNYSRNIAATVVTTNPIITGSMFLRASSNGSTLHIAAAGITAQGISVPPHTHSASIWPRAVSVATPPPR